MSSFYYDFQASKQSKTNKHEENNGDGSTIRCSNSNSCRNPSQGNHYWEYDDDAMRDMIDALYQNDIERVFRLVDRRMNLNNNRNGRTSTSGSNASSTLASSSSLYDRHKLLFQYFPSTFVDAYCCPKQQQELPMISHDELIEALRTCPHLVMDETPMDKYLVQLCGSPTSSDPQIIYKAAKKIASHWKLRKFLFQERAFLPMAQTSPQTNGIVGALSEEDMEWFNTGYFVLLRPTCDPIKKRSVLAIDPSRLPMPQASGPRYDWIKLRITFYMLWLVSMTNPVTQNEGFVLFDMLNFQKKSPFFGNMGLFVMREAMPIADMEALSMFFPSNFQDQSFMSLCISSARYTIELFRSHLFRSNILFGYSDEQVVQKIIRNGGFDRRDFPTWFGGTGGWDMGSFFAWQQQQMQSEARKYMGQSINGRTTRIVLQGNDDESKIERERRLGAARSRRKRAKFKNNFQNLKQKAHDLQLEHERLRNENVRLESLLVYAQEEVLVCDGLIDGGKSIEQVDEHVMTVSSPLLSPFFETDVDIAAASALDFAGAMADIDTINDPLLALEELELIPEEGMGATHSMYN